jgi:hypothetical protein
MIYFLSTPVRLGFSKTGRVLGALYAWKMCRTPVCVIYNRTAVCDTSILVSVQLACPQLALTQLVCPQDSRADYTPPRPSCSGCHRAQALQ